MTQMKSFTELLNRLMAENELPPSQCRLDGAISDSAPDCDTLSCDILDSNHLGCDTLVLLAHGAGANMDHDFMVQMAARLAQQDIAVVRFNFPYMRNNALDGKRRPPDRAPKLLKDFALHLEAIRQIYQPRRLVVMGKSMGGRMAAILAGETRIDGVICLGYPFVPPKGGDPRLAPIAQCQSPLLVIQGERDKFGGKGLVENWLAPLSAKLEWLTDGDHSFQPRKSSGTSLNANLDQAVVLSMNFIRGLDA